MNRIARAPDEAFDADQISDWRCDECGEDEYNCVCGDYYCVECGSIETGGIFTSSNKYICVKCNDA